MRRREARDRAHRVRLLAAEIDIQVVRTTENTRAIETKSGFIAAAAGLVATVTVTSIADSNFWVVGLIPMAFAVLTVAYATTALWPRAVNVPGARLLIENNLDSAMTPAELEDFLLEVRVVEIENRDTLNEDRTKWMKAGFKLLIWSLGSLILVAVVNGMTAEGNAQDGEETNTHQPGETPGPTGRPSSLQTSHPLERAGRAHEG
jgi:hypothetical protein